MSYAGLQLKFLNNVLINMIGDHGSLLVNYIYANANSLVVFCHVAMYIYKLSTRCDWICKNLPSTHKGHKIITSS